MIKYLYYLLLFIFFGYNSKYSQNLYEYVDPFIGSVGDGNVFVGPSCPFGMVKPGPDFNIHSNSGYDSDLRKPLLGISQVHVSGTGGGPKYGNISLMPFNGEFNNFNQTSLRINEKTSAGYYSVNLTKWNIDVELTTSDRVAFHKYHYNGNSKPGIKIDVGSFLGEESIPDSREAQQFVGSEIQILSNSEIQGYSRIRGGWNNGSAYTVYFYATFDTPCESYGIWNNNQITPSEKNAFDNGKESGAWFSYKTSANQKIKMKID